MPGASSGEGWARPQSPRIPWAILMFLDLKEQLELSSAHPPEFEITVAHNHDMVRTKRIKLTETSTV